MQSYTTQALTYANQYLTTIKEWWWPNTPIPQTPLQQFKFYVQNSNIKFKTKHSDDNIIIERLCMMYNQLITADHGKYAGFKSSVERPLYFIEMGQFQGKQESGGDVGDRSIVTIVGNIKVSAQKIKCNIQVTFVIHSKIQQQLPLIFIRNPDATKTQANPNYLGANSNYEQVLGGITTSKKIKNSLQEQWRSYKATNLFILLKNIDKLIHDNFPFVKRYTKLLDLQSNPAQLIVSTKLKSIFSQTLPKTQELVVMSESISSENSYLKEQNARLKIFLKEHQEKYGNGDVISLFKIEKNAQLLELISMQKALLDCIRLIQNQVQKPNAKDQLNSIAQLLKQWSGKLFETRWKIRDVMQNVHSQIVQYQ